MKEQIRLLKDLIKLHAFLYVSTHMRGLQLQKFIYELLKFIRTSGHNVRFSLGARQENISKCVQLLCRLLDVSLQLKHLHWMLVSVRLKLVHLELTCFKTSASNSAQHKREPFLIVSLASLGTTQQNICANVHNYYASRLAGLNACLRKVLTHILQRENRVRYLSPLR